MRYFRLFRLSTLAVIFTLAVCASSPAQSAADAAVRSGGSALEFNRDIRPILSDTCFACHGPDKNQRKGKLRLDVREDAIEKKAIAPGRPDESELVKRIFTTVEDDMMPPPDSHKQITSAQKELLKRWVAEGAKYQAHWAYLPPQRTAAPLTKKARWIRTPIDAFILQKLESKNIQPSREADKRTLLRRLSLDLIGLPPTTAEMKSFLADKSPRAYERQVERLLASPHFGERMAAPWLDLARFADTVGYHGDQNQRIFPYRDYVIDSFNRNKPFDQFTIEQLAGDLLPNPTLEQRVATGFNRLNMVTREGGAQPREYLAKYAADRVRTVSTTWLGSTMGCAECHDHKYDPFSTRDFYSLAAFFADVKQWGVYQDYDYTPNPDLKGWSNDHPFPPEIEVPSPYLKKRIENLRHHIGEVAVGAALEFKTNRTARADFEAWRKDSLAFLEKNPSGWTVPRHFYAITDKTNEAPVKSWRVELNEQIVLDGKPDDNVSVLLLIKPGVLSAIRVELLPHEQHGGKVARGENDTTSISLSASIRHARKTNETEVKEEKLPFYFADANYQEPRYANGYEIIGVKDSWRTARAHQSSPHVGVWLLDVPRQIGGDFWIIKLGKTSAGCVRISVSPFAAPDEVALRIAPRNPASGPTLPGDSRERLSQLLRKTSWTRADRELVHETYLFSTGWNKEALHEARKCHRELLECRDGKFPSLVTEAWPPVTTRVLPRGNWQDERGDIVHPLPPHFLPQPKSAAAERLTRLDLAHWLVSPENPLTARVFVNRLWKQFFGAGICNTVDDLGAQGEWPVHPELLDWLASEFMQPTFAAESAPAHAWDVKHLIRLMVLSSTYRQDSTQRLDLVEIDPNNRLLSFQSPRRLDAEFVRDNALAVAGLLNTELGGPSDHPYQPPRYYEALQFPDRDYLPERDERQYRRGVYTHWQRTFLHPMMANFDAPAREECTANRTLSNTPQQALTLLNDPTFVEAARVFAGKILTPKRASDEQRLDAAFQQALLRPAKSVERDSLKKFLATQRDYYRSNADEAKKLLHIGQAPTTSGADASELAAWASVCRVVLNLHETITRY
ncbi:MAG: PSD1 domain-containing protein [Verrucomicrobia bacterium]|nr:PSD1 domain-containing protein [Verrucomicrobiota bacterium]